ncbi:uncharacterized protein ACN427_004704 isoform 2-T2 [Glossina fuscipes fuscipes]
MVLTCFIVCWLISNSNAYDAFYSAELETTPYLQPLSFNLQNDKTVDTALRSQKQYTKVQQLFEIVSEWRKLDFEYRTYEQRQQAIINRLNNSKDAKVVLILNKGKDSNNPKNLRAIKLLANKSKKITETKLQQGTVACLMDVGKAFNEVSILDFIFEKLECTFPVQLVMLLFIR